METFSLVAVGAGIGAAIAASLLAGLIYGLGFAIDTAREHDPEHEPDAFDQAFEQAGHTPGFIVQMLILSIGACVLSGAVTAWLSPAAPWLNATLVGAVGTLLGLLGAHNMPPVLTRLSLVVTLPATLAGAWGLSLLAG